MDSYTFRLYAAEQSIHPGQDLADIAAVRAFVRRPRRSAWWKTAVGSPPVSIGVRISGRQVGTELIESWAAGRPRHGATTWLLHMHPQMLNEVVVLHELAHTIEPKMTGDVQAIRRGAIGGAYLHDHGPAFTAILAELVRRFATGRNHEDLLAAYEHFEVPVMEITEALASRQHSRDVERAVQEQIDAVAERTRVAARLETPMPPHTIPGPHGWLPRIEWGWWLRSTRRWRPGVPLVSRVALAVAISPVVPCSERDIRRIEEAEDPITDDRLRRIAMCAVAVLDFDAVRARTELGLARSNCGEPELRLDELAEIAPQWTGYVGHLNRMLAARPPFWQSTGSR